MNDSWVEKVMALTLMFLAAGILLLCIAFVIAVATHQLDNSTTTVQITK